MDSVTGDKQLDRKLKALSDSGARKAMRAGITAGMTPLVKALRAAVNAAPVSAALKRSARKTIGKRFGKAKGGEAKGQYQAKVGFGVGKKRSAPKERGKRKGVGIGVANIHWPVLGTLYRRTKAGHDTGAMPAALKGLPAKAIDATKDAVLEAARNKIRETITREAAKKG